MAACDIAAVGKIGSPYGVKGWFHVQSYTSPTDNLRSYTPWLMSSADSGPWRTMVGLESRRHQKGIVAKLAAVNDRETAGRLRGQWIGVDEDQFGQAQHGEFFWRDIIGCRVIGADGTDFGVVDHLIETGAHDVLVVPSVADKGTTDVLIPFVDAYVVNVDLQAKRIEVNWDHSWR